MVDISNKVLTIITLVALLSSIASFLSFPQITGKATSDSGIAMINITTQAAINITHKVIDFGNGTIEPSYVGVNCTLTSDGNLTGTGNTDPQNCWTGLGASQGINVVNVGNIVINVSVTSTKNGSLFSGGTSFWGITGTTYMWRCTNGNGSSDLSGFTTIQNGTATKCVSYLNATFGQDAFTLHINITFPDTATGFKNDTLTFTGSQAS